MEIKDRIEREKELFEEMKMVHKLSVAVLILTVLLIGSNAVWLFVVMK